MTSVNNIVKYVQINILDGKYDDIIQNLISQEQYNNIEYNNEFELINFLLKCSSQSIDKLYLLLFFDYKKYIHYPTFISLYCENIVKIGEHSEQYQSNLPFPMMCYTRAMDILQSCLLTTPMDSYTRLKILNTHHKTFKNVCQGYNYYQYIEKWDSKNTTNNIVLTMTTCKRLDLFIRTVQSFLVCCKDIDLINHWIVIDDNSSEHDRTEMKRMFPWIEYIFKNENEKGHAKSMNILKKYIQTKYNPDYILHIEDDWKFVSKHNYIEHALSVLNTDSDIKQVLFNMNYAETESQLIEGGFLKITKDNKYYYLEHEYNPVTDNIKQSRYWPHFSMRPSLLKSNVYFEEEFNENSKHFEYEFALKYVSKGYKSAFFPSILCIHTGKLTSEIGENAYTLNNQIQFKKNEIYPLESVYVENIQKFTILKRFKKLRNKTWFCHRIKDDNAKDNHTRYINYIVNGPLNVIDWDIIFIVKDDTRKILLNRLDELQNASCIVGYVVSSQNIDILLTNYPNFDTQKHNIIICS